MLYYVAISHHAAEVAVCIVSRVRTFSEHLLSVQRVQVMQVSIGETLLGPIQAFVKFAQLNISFREGTGANLFTVMVADKAVKGKRHLPKFD